MRENQALENYDVLKNLKCVTNEREKAKFWTGLLDKGNEKIHRIYILYRLNACSTSEL